MAAAPAEPGHAVTGLWQPRPPAADEPACWSWPVPPIRDVAAEVAAALVRQQGLPPGKRLDAATLEWLYDDSSVIRWQEFHSGARIIDAAGAPERCAICGGPQRSRARLIDDHCHVTGQIRGRLCGRCNTREGRSNDPIFARYRAWHPAAILDAHEMYSGFTWTDGWDARQHGDVVRTGVERPPTPWPAFPGR